MRALIPSSEIRGEPATICNYSCLMCPRGKLVRHREIMPNELFEQIVRQAKTEVPHLEICTVSGYGEFAVDPDWKRKLFVAAALFPRVHVVTNLSLIQSEDDLKTLAALTTEVRVSINALGEARYREIHRPPAGVDYARLERQVERLAMFRGPDFELRLTFTALPETEDQVDSWIERWSSVVDGLEVWRPHNWIYGRDYRSVGGERMETCGRPAHGPIQVQVDGTVNVCCYDFNGELIIGDLKRETLAEIYSGKRMCRIRALHRNGRADSLAPCARCDQREPFEQRQKHLIYCSFEASTDRVKLTSSGKERLPV
jgi:hypothetical protein